MRPKIRRPIHDKTHKIPTKIRIRKRSSYVERNNYRKIARESGADVSSVSPSVKAKASSLQYQKQSEKKIWKLEMVDTITAR